MALNCKFKKDLVEQQPHKSRETLSPGLGYNKIRSVTVIFSNSAGE